MALAHALFVGTTAHARTRPKKHAFHYTVYYLCFPLREKAKLRGALLSLNRFNLFSFYDRDHGRAGLEPESWIRNILAEHRITTADGDVVLMALPRVLGYVFNPVSFWFCLDTSGALRAVLAEVNNTFGDRHSYLLAHDDQRPIAAGDVFPTKKIFHVSPFIDVDGTYEFRFDYGEERLGVWITHRDVDGILLTTSLVGTRRSLSSANLFACFFRYPLMTLKVIGLIHYHAVRLVMKGVRYRSRPTPPEQEVSR